MSNTSTVRRLESWLQEEFGARRALIDILEAQEEALLGGDLDRVEACNVALEESATAALARRRRRDPLLAELADAHGVAPGSLTVGGLVERLGAGGARLARLRSELLELGRRERELVRRNAGLARVQAQATTEILSVLVGSPDGGDPGATPGGLINARA